MDAKYLLYSLSVFLLAAPVMAATPNGKIAAVQELAAIEEKTRSPITSEPSEQILNTIAPNLVNPPAIVAEMPGNALEQITPEQEEASSPEEMEQVTNVSQLRDVQPSDWAYEAVRSLVERYGCIAGYPDGTFRGNRSLTRYEFAAGLNACLGQIEKLIGSSKPDGVPKQDLDTIAQLVAQFQPELAGLRTRVDQLENRTAFLENHQFSTTAVFGGEAIFGISDASGGNPPGTGVANTVFNHLTRVGIVTTFSGTDRLRLTLATGNFDNSGFANALSLNTRMALLSYQAGLQNQMLLDSLEYRTPVLNNRVVLTFKPIGFSLSDVLTANSPYFDAGRGSISRFGEASPVFKIGALDAGVGFDFLLSDRVRFQAAYGVRNANNPTLGIGKSDHSNLGLQFLLKPANTILTGVSFITGYAADGRLDTFTGSFNADTSGQFFTSTPMRINALNGTLQWRISPQVTFGTWGGIIYSQGVNSDAYAVTSTYLFSLGFPDPLGRRGDLLGLLVGQPPRLFTGNGPVTVDPGKSFHYEAFYRFRVSDNISITPGFFMVTEPGHISGNKTIYVGTIRTTFRF